nr:MAG TPA: hypothetical protein [Caudoviricetes sp.]
MNKNMTCRNFQYEIGKTYEMDEAKIRKSGLKLSIFLFLLENSNTKVELT